jgi:hypothetical protein
MMGKICAPVRDEKVRELQLVLAEGVVPVFRGILEVSHILEGFFFVSTLNGCLSKNLQFPCNWQNFKRKISFL